MAFLGALIGGLSALQFGATLLQAKAQKDAVKEQKLAQRHQTAIEVEKNRKAAVGALREARIKAAMVQQAAVNTGAQGSSGEAGAIGSIRTQAATAVGFQNVQAQAAKNTTNFLTNASDAESKAAMFGAASNIFGNLSRIAQGGG